jgi:ribosomal RNA-processing protein 9
MIGSKRKASRGTSKTQRGGKPSRGIKQKPLEERLKNSRVSRDDEEILSGSEEGNLDKDDFFEDEGEVEIQGQGEKIKKREKVENADEKRLRLAKKLISKIGEEVKTHDDDADFVIDNQVDQFIMDEIKKEKHDYFLELSNSANFNPFETAFYKGHLSSVTAVDISSDSKYAISCSKDCRGIKWDLATGKKFLLPPFTKKPLFACTFTPDDRYALFGGADKYIHQVDLHNEKVVQSFKAHNDTITGIMFDQNNDQFYSTSRDNTLKVWAVGTTQKSILLETFYGHIDKINDMDVVNTGLKNESGGMVNRILTCGSDRQINLWKVDQQSFLNFKETENSLFSYDSIKSLNTYYFVSGTFEGTLSLWRNNKKKPMSKVLNAHGVQKSVSINHSFFTNSNLDQEEMEMMNGNNSINSLNASVEIPYPVLSLSAIRNSDLLFSGSCDGNLNVYKYTKAIANKTNPSLHVKEKIDLLKKVPLNNRGCVNAMKVNKTNEFMVLGFGKDSRLGRWDTINKSKNGICVVKLFD